MKLMPVAALLAAISFPVAAAEPGQLSFSTDPGPAANIARTLMGAERGTPLLDDDVVEVALVDIDEDGTSEIFAFADSSYFCGSAGCVPRIYRLDRDTGKWNELPIETEAVINSEPANWSIAPAHAGNWSVLQMQTGVVRLYLAWNGTAFVSIPGPQ